MAQLICIMQTHRAAMYEKYGGRHFAEFHCYSCFTTDLAEYASFQHTYHFMPYGAADMYESLMLANGAELRSIYEGLPHAQATASHSPMGIALKPDPTLPPLTPENLQRIQDAYDEALTKGTGPLAATLRRFQTGEIVPGTLVNFAFSENGDPFVVEGGSEQPAAEPEQTPRPPGA